MAASVINGGDSIQQFKNEKQLIAKICFDHKSKGGMYLFDSAEPGEKTVHFLAS